MTAELCRDALAAVREALDIPHAATVGDDETRQRILDERLVQVVVTLRAILDDSTGADGAWHVGYLREQLAKHPATGYRTWADAHAAPAAEQETTP